LALIGHGHRNQAGVPALVYGTGEERWHQGLSGAGACRQLSRLQAHSWWPGTSGVVTGLPLVLLRSEGVALLAMATVLYGSYGRSWWLFLALLPVPDLGLLGQLRSRHAGAVTYDLTHTYVLPAALGLVGVHTGSGLAVALALVWFAHIGMDRALGLGLLYPDGSGRTHLRAALRDQNEGGSWTA
jgi:Domain of unknown function (DUF4260)